MANYNKYADNNSNGPIEFKLVEKLGILERHKSGWCREINIVAWNGGRPKFDIRDWDPNHIRMSRGITLYENEAIKLTKILAQRLQMDNEEQQIHYRALQVQNEEQQIDNDEQEMFADQQEDFDGDLMHYADNQTDPSISQAYAS